MALLIYDPVLEAGIEASRSAADDRLDEVWEGAKVVSPLPNDEHQDIQYVILLALGVAVYDRRTGRVRGGVNVSDRADGWAHNYRCPDAVVYLTGNPAVNRGTFWQGGPDFLVEIVSPGEDPYAKLGFYAHVNTREVLIVHRDPWAVELFELRAGTLVLAGRSDLATPVMLMSAATELAFQLVPGPARPEVRVSHPPTGREWLA